MGRHTCCRLAVILGSKAETQARACRMTSLGQPGWKKKFASEACISLSRLHSDNVAMSCTYDYSTSRTNNIGIGATITKQITFLVPNMFTNAMQEELLCFCTQLGAMKRHAQPVEGSLSKTCLPCTRAIYRGSCEFKLLDF